MLFGRHATQTFREVGPLELKGIPTPVDVVEVLWEPTEQCRWRNIAERWTHASRKETK